MRLSFCSACGHSEGPFFYEPLHPEARSRDDVDEKIVITLCPQCRVKFFELRVEYSFSSTGSWNSSFDTHDRDYMAYLDKIRPFVEYMFVQFPGCAYANIARHLNMHRLKTYKGHNFTASAAYKLCQALGFYRTSQRGRTYKNLNLSLRRARIHRVWTKRFQEWCEARNKPFLPTDVATLTEWIVTYPFSNAKVLAHSLAGIGAMHKESGFHSPTVHPLVLEAKRLWENKFNGTKPADPTGGGPGGAGTVECENPGGPGDEGSPT